MREGVVAESGRGNGLAELLPNGAARTPYPAAILAARLFFDHVFDFSEKT